MAAPHALCSRHETSMYHSWAETNPELFTAAVVGFHRDHPVEEWKHFLDMSLKHQIKLIAVRRTEPFNADRDYLNEIGMGR